MILSADAIIAIAAASPNLHKLQLGDAALSTHPAIACAIVGGYCEHIEDIILRDRNSITCNRVRAEEVVSAYQSAVAAAGRRAGYKAFTSMKMLLVTVCWCTPASVWHALLSLFKHAELLHMVDQAMSNDAMVTAALSYLPDIRALSSDSLWPGTFADFMMATVPGTRRPVYVAVCHVVGHEHGACPGGGMPLLLSEHIDPNGIAGPTIYLQEGCGLFAAYRRSLSAERRAVMARWSKGDFMAGDEQESAVESALVQCDKPDSETGRRPCRHGHMYWTRSARPCRHKHCAQL